MKKQYIWIFSILIVGVMIFGFWSIFNRAFSAENALEASYQKGFYNLLEYVNNLNLLISKSEVTSSDEQKILILTTIWHQAEGARNSLASLPLGDRDMTNMQKFFAQLGDFSYATANKLVKKQDITEKEWDILTQFRKNIRTLNQDLRRLQDDVASGKINWGRKQDRLISVKQVKGLADNLESIDQKLKDQVPTITYDGPFSDHVEAVEPKGVSGNRISEEEAREVAKKFLSKVIEGDFAAEVAGKAKGTIPAYTVEINKDGDTLPDIIMDISQVGGHVIWFLNTRTIESSKIPIKQAVESARKFLENIGYKNMEATGSLRENNTITVTFVPKEGKVLLYPDFIKVEVALDTGEIVGMNALAFLTFHANRNLPEPQILEEEVIEKLNKKLHIERIRLALIPDKALNEIFCYEVDARLEQDRFFIYINAQNGNEEQVLKVVETDMGTMTM